MKSLNCRCLGLSLQGRTPRSPRRRRRSSSRDSAHERSHRKPKENKDSKENSKENAEKENREVKEPDGKVPLATPDTAATPSPPDMLAGAAFRVSM